MVGIPCRKDKARERDMTLLGTMSRTMYRLEGKWDTEAGSDHGGY